MKTSQLLPILALAVGACQSASITHRNPGPAPDNDVAVASKSTAKSLGVPPGHLPPPGTCRVWIPGTPPGHQPHARTCQGIEASAPAGALILYRPSKDRRHVRVQYVHAERTGVIVRIRLFDASTGRFVRDVGS